MSSQSISYLLGLPYSKPGVLLVIFAVLCWVLWYAWRFLLTPWLCQLAPKELPYYIPYVGHLPSMLKDSHTLYKNGMKYFGSTREPFAVTVMGETLYIISNHEDMSTIFKQSKLFDYDAVIQEHMLMHGLQPQTLARVFRKGYTTAGNQSFMDLSHHLFRQQLHPGENFSNVWVKVFANFTRLVTLDKIQEHLEHVEIDAGENHKILSLWTWTREVFVDAVSRAFFAEQLFQLAPDLKFHFYAYDEDMKHPFKLPAWLAPRLHVSTSYLEDAFTRYLKIPREQRLNESYIVRTFDESLDSLGISPEQKGTFMLIFFRLINTNAFKISFWLLAYILFDENLKKDICAEVARAFDEDNQLNMDRLLSECPLLNAMWEEALRVGNWPLGARRVSEDTVLGGKSLRHGHRVVLAFRHLHDNPTIFGDEPDFFEPRRFLEKRGLNKNPSWKPFGGGATLCPGRYLAKREALMFVALFLGRFDVSLDGSLAHQNAKIPEMATALAVGSVRLRKDNFDVFVQVRQVEVTSDHLV